jgi:uncharacterized membrane protein
VKRTLRDINDSLLLAAVFAVAYSTCGLFRHWHFDSSAYDLGIFDQAIWHLSRFEAPSSTVRGVSNLLGDHFSPILAVLAPLYWAAPGPEGLIVAQAILIAASIIPVWLYARRRLPRGAACGIAVAYGLFWGMQRAATFDFHEFAFAPLIVATMILAMEDERWVLFWAMAATLVATKEDLIPLIGGFGLLLAWRGRMPQAAAAVIISVIAFAVVVGYVIPAMSDSGEFGYTSAYVDVIRNPWRVPVALVTPLIKVRTTLLLFAPFLCLTLLSPLTILIAPIAVERFLSASPNHWGTVFHYWAPVAPIIAMGAADGLRRLSRLVTERWSEVVGTRLVRTCVAVSVVLSAILPGHQPVLRLFRTDHYRISGVQRLGASIVARIPPNSAVVAQGAVVPHLSNREHLFVFDANAPDAEYVIVTDRLDPWPLGSVHELRALVDARRARGYRSIIEQDGWILLRRTTVVPPDGHRR